jgi:hypothetical protein
MCLVAPSCRCGIAGDQRPLSIDELTFIVAQPTAAITLTNANAATTPPLFTREDMTFSLALYRASGYCRRISATA